MRRLAILVVTVLLPACSLVKDLGSRADLDAVAERATEVFLQTLGDEEYTGAPNLRISGWGCEHSDLVRLSGIVWIDVDDVRDPIEVYQGMVTGWSMLPDAVRFATYGSEVSPGYRAESWMVSGGDGVRGGFDLFASVDPERRRISVQVGTGCYRNE